MALAVPSTAPRMLGVIPTEKSRVSGVIDGPVRRPPRPLDQGVIAGRAARGLEQAHDLAGLLGGDRQRRAAVEVLGDVAVVARPSGRGPLARRLSTTSPSSPARRRMPSMLGRLGRGVDVAGAEGLLLGVDART